ncbi:hypothetical protein B9Z55_002959 [Caenorhabditis nigoni]|uniref:Uncharacterized protein n=1 Tax=Caenorhabditis nigoni TaxID=1611254 RepID=A0A2G5VMS4_9PELO|nr:hypothetical protein B9Z55_002959 [Caenorhabditis nigoni]
MNSTTINSTIKILNDTLNQPTMEGVTIWEATSLGFTMRVIYVLSILMMFLGIIWIYEWVQSTKASEQSITPTIPFEEEGLTVHNGDHGEKFYCGYNDVGQRKNRSMNTLREILEMVYDTRLRDYGEFLQDARIISIKMPGFENGGKCHEFVLKNGTMPSGSGFSYQMYGDNAIQVTRYYENGVGYIAGFCIYIRMEYEWGIRFRKAFIKEILESRRYGRPGCDECNGFWKCDTSGMGFDRRANGDSTVYGMFQSTQCTTTILLFDYHCLKGFISNY